MTESVDPRLSMASAANPMYRETYAAAARWRDDALLGGGSLFGGTPAWTAEASAELKRRFIDGADMGEGTFMEKLHGQLEGAPQAVYQVAAELLYIHLLALVNVSPEKKLEIINGVAERAPVPFAVPDDLVPPLAAGIVNGGVGFNTHRFWLVSFLIEFTERWLALEETDKVRVASDPWAFKELLYSIPVERSDSQRNALLFLLFKDTFEDITSVDHKRRIIAAHAEVAGDDPDLDRQLLAARTALSERFENDFSWYSPEVRPTWDHDYEPDTNAAAVLHQALPNQDAQLTFARTMAAAIQAANDVNPRSWSVTLLPDGIALNVAMNRALSVIDRNLSTMFSGTADDLQPAVDAAGLKDVAQKGYDFPKPNSLLITSDHAAWLKLMAKASATHLDAVRRAAVRGTPFARYFSEDAVQLIETLAGVELPRPPRRGDGGAWLVRIKREGKREVREALGRGDCRVNWPIDVPPGSSLEAIKSEMSEVYPDISNNKLGSRAGNLHRFITKMETGDLVLSPDGQDLFVGTVVGDAYFNHDERQWVRPMDWHNIDAPVGRSDVSSALYSQLRSLLTITEISTFHDELSRWIAGDGEEVQVSSATLPSSAHLTPMDSDAAGKLLLDQEWLQDIIEMLAEKNQLIFYGPPGTGKTYLAERLARHIVSDPANYRIVQFHPSYSYEDFVEGFRPLVDRDTGTMIYDLRPGPFKQLADEARENPGEPYVLIIDEINRGNLAKIFGELYYLLEYRDEPIVLQYGSGTEDEFSLPENLYVIGTMNTADRSIAMVDAAIRRRFWFVEFSPTVAPIDGLLDRWLTYHGKSDRAARILNELNARLDDSDYAIGPSYLMNENIDDRKVLDRVWDHAIMPLLVEHFYGQRGATDRFTLDAIFRTLDGSNAEAANDDRSENAITSEADDD